MLLIAFYLIESGKGLKQAPFIKEIMSGEGIKLKDIHYSQDDPEEGMRWALDAAEVRFSGDAKTIYFQDFLLKVEPESQNSFQVKGRKGDYSRDSGVMNLWGDIEGNSSNGYKVLTEHMMINEKTRQASTDKPVKIFGPFFTILGRGLFLDLEKERLQILSDVTTTLERETLI